MVHTAAGTPGEGSTVHGDMGHEDVLAATDFFSGLDRDALNRLAAASATRRLVRGDVLFGEGDEPDAVYVVLRGRIAIANKSFDGRESVVALMESGDLFGDMGLLDGLPRSAEARALEGSEVLQVPNDPIQAVLQERPTLLWGVVRMLAMRLRNMDEALADAVFLDVTGRTAKRLLELANGADEFVLPVTQEELAGMVGASRERVNKAIASFIRLGWIDQRDRRYRILQRDRLQQRSR
jgi:CRP/FNR family transcriptional regulator, cyclic AMP receptor protein